MFQFIQIAMPLMTSTSSVVAAHHSAFSGLGCVIRTQTAMTPVMSYRSCANTVGNVVAISMLQIVS